MTGEVLRTLTDAVGLLVGGKGRTRFLSKGFSSRQSEAVERDWGLPT